MVKSCNRGNKLYRCSYLGHSGEPCCEQIVHRRCCFAMEGFRNRLPHVGCQVYVQDSIGGEVAVYLADDSLLEGDRVIILCPLLYHVLLAGTRPLCYVMYTWFCIAANMVMIMHVSIVKPVDLGRYINFNLWNDSNLPVCTNLRHFFMSLLNPVAHITLKSALKSLSPTSNQVVVSDCLTVRWI